MTAKQRNRRMNEISRKGYRVTAELHRLEARCGRLRAEQCRLDGLLKRVMWTDVKKGK